MEEFVDQTEYKWKIVDGTYYGGYFKVFFSYSVIEKNELVKR